MTRHLWGTLETGNAEIFTTLGLSYTQVAAQEMAAGIGIAQFSFTWKDYETADGVFNEGYLSWFAGNVNTFLAAGSKIDIQLSLHYPPAWVMAISNSRYINQFGVTAPLIYGWDDPNYVFNTTIRTKAGDFINHSLSTLNAAITGGLANVWSFRVDLGVGSEANYAPSDDGSGHINSYWAYDANAQGSASNRPTGVSVCPYPGWHPGDTTWNSASFTTTQAQTWYTWYFNARMNFVNWHIGLFRTAGYNGYLAVETAGYGTRPDEYTNNINNRLNGTYDPNRTMSRASVWQDFYPALTNKTNIIAYISSLADGSGIPANNCTQASDQAVDFYNDLAVKNWSGTRYVTYLAQKYGLAVGGENPGYGSPSLPDYGYAMMVNTAQQAVTSGLLVVFWAHDQNLYLGTNGLSVSMYANVIANTDTLAHTLYGSSVLDAIGLANASKMASVAGGAETFKTTVLTGSNVYGEVWSQGSAGLATVASIPATPTGRGWICYPGAGTFQAGNWSAVLNAKVAAGGSTEVNTQLTLRAFKYSSGSFTSIGTLTSVRRPFSANNTKTLITFAAVSFGSVTLAASDGVYFDLWWYDNETNAAADNPTIYESSSGIAGYTNDFVITTSSFTALSTTRSITGVSAATKALGVSRPISGVSAALATVARITPMATWGTTMGLWSNTQYLSPQVVGWAQTMGLDCFRIQIGADRIWRNYSDPPSAWSWNQLDDAIYQITQAGMHAIHTVQSPPANPTPDNWYKATSEPYYMPYAYDFATYAGAVAARYNGTSDVISNGTNYGKLTLYSLEIGNEGANIHFTSPNATPAWVGYNNSPYDMYNGIAGVTPGHKAQPARDPYYYVPVITQCVSAIKAVNSVTRIGMGSMWWVHPGGSQFSGGTRGASRSNYHNFLDYLYLQGVMADLSYINFHYYTNTSTPDVGDGQTVTIDTALADMIEVMNAYGDTTKPIWITEWNWQVPNDCTETEQNRRGGYVLDALIACGRVQTVIFYTLNDQNTADTNASSWIYNNGTTWVQRTIYSTFTTKMAAHPTLYNPTQPRTITGVSAAVKALGVSRPISGVSAVIGAIGHIRSISGISTAMKALGVPHTVTPVSVATKAFGVPRAVTSVSATTDAGAGPLGVYVSGQPVPAQQANISFDQRLDDRASGSFSVVDEDGMTYPLQERQQVELIDTTHLLILYRGFIDRIDEQALSPAASSSDLLRTVTLEDLRALAEERQCTEDYANWTAGNIAADLVRTRLTDKQIVANFAMRRDHDAAAFGQGTLSGVQATNGYLELARAGSDVTHVETTTADFASGTLSGVSATKNSLQLTKYKAMRFSAYAGGSTGVNAGNYLSYWSIWQGAITINDNDYIDYYIWHSSESVEAVGGVDVICSDGTTLRDTHVEDQNAGIDTHPNASLQGYATDRWYYRKIGFVSGMNGKSIKTVALAMEGDKEGYHCFYVRAIKLHSASGTLRTTFFDTSIQRIGFIRQIGYYKPWIILRDVYGEYGSRTAPALSLNGAGIAGQSVISWTEATTAQSTGTSMGASSQDRPKQVVIESTIDGGDTWQTCENGKPIPSLPVGMDLTGKSMLVRQTLNVGGPNPELTPSLSECTLAVEAAYNSSKVDVSRSYSGNEMTDGTNSLCGYQAAINTADGPEYNDVSGLKMNGWRKNWKTGERTNHLLYGPGTPFMGIRSGYLFLHADPGGSDAHVRFADAGTYSSLVIEAMIFPPSNGNAGLLYDTTYWGNTDNSFGYYVYISTTVLGFGKGANANSNTFLGLASASVLLEADSWHQLRVVRNTSDHVHHIFLDDIELITHTDSTYSSGGVGIRMSSPTDVRLAYFDAFGVSSNTALTTATRTAPSASLNTALSVGDSRIWWAENKPGSTTLDVQTSIDGGSSYTSCTNGEAIPGLSAGLSLSGKSLLVKILLGSDSVAYTPTLLGISWQVIGAFSASGSRTAPVLDGSPAGTVGSSSVTWDADVPASGTLAVTSSLNGSSWSTVGASGDSVAGLVEQGACWWDTFDTDTHTNYSYTAGHWLWDTAQSRLVTQSSSDALALNGVSTLDAEMVLIADRVESLQILLRNSGYGHYDLQISDDDAAGGHTLDFVRYTPAGGSVTLQSEHSQSITRGVYHTIRVTLIGANYTVWLDGVQVYMGIDPSPLTESGSCGLWFASSTTSYIRDLAIRPLGQDATTGVNVSTRTSLTSSNAVESPKVRDLVACVRHPFIATGAVIPQTDFAYKKSVAEALDEIASSSQMGWRFNESYRLVMQPRDGQFAPFVLWQGENGTIEGTSLPKVSRQSPTYRNRQYVTGAVELVEEPESKLGNGVDTSWSLDYAIDSLVSISMGEQVQTFGIKDTDTGKTFYYTKGEKTLSLDAALNPPTSQIDVVYIARKDYRAMAEDTGQQAIIATAEGSLSGIIEASESIDGLSKEAADALAVARLAEHARLSLTLSLTTRQSGLAPGQLVTVVIQKHDLIDLQLLITGVSTQMRQQIDGTLLYWYSIDATTGPSLGSWARALRFHLIQKGGLS